MKEKTTKIENEKVQNFNKNNVKNERILIKNEKGKKIKNRGGAKNSKKK